MKFEYAPAKSASNKEKHGLSLKEATGLWSVTAVEIEARVVDEPRFMRIGRMNGKFYSCIYTIRGASLRLISARRSRKTEENIYYEHIKT